MPASKFVHGPTETLWGRFWAEKVLDQFWNLDPCGVCRIFFLAKKKVPIFGDEKNAQMENKQKRYDTKALPNKQINCIIEIFVLFPFKQV